VGAAAPKDRQIIVDVFCGVGGNTIAFALSGRWKRVYAIEKDAATLACAKHNAAIYGVADRITWFQGDCFEILGVDEDHQKNAVGALKTILSQYGVIFGSPPWGGRSRLSQSCLRRLIQNRSWIQKCRSLQPRNHGALLLQLHLRETPQSDPEYGLVSPENKRSTTNCQEC